jgi:hypothetical protein
MHYGAIIRQGWRGFARNAWVLVGFALVYALVIGLIRCLASLVSGRIIEAGAATGSLWLLVPYLLLLLLQVVAHLLGQTASAAQMRAGPNLFVSTGPVDLTAGLRHALQAYGLADEAIVHLELV